ncbi:hypothetical protein V6Z11_D08G261400 [Gossypium hirsutum]
MFMIIIQLSPPPSEPTRSPAENHRADECRQILFKNVDTNCYLEILKSFDRGVASKLKSYCSKKLAAAPST